MDKLSQLTAHIDRNLQFTTITPTQRFILARDQAYFKAVFFSGDRPGDMGQVKVPEILRFPNDDGFLFNHVWGNGPPFHPSVLKIRVGAATRSTSLKALDQYSHILITMNVKGECWEIEYFFTVKKFIFI